MYTLVVAAPGIRWVDYEMKRALARICSRHGAAALLLLVLLPAEAANLALLARERPCECRHDSCPMRPPAKAAKAEPPSCHGRHHQAAQPEPGASSIRATCGCGHSHSPAAPHRESRAVLEPVLAALLPLPAGFLGLPDGAGLSDLLPDPAFPPPRFPVSA